MFWHYYKFQFDLFGIQGVKFCIDFFGGLGIRTDQWIQLLFLNYRWQFFTMCIITDWITIWKSYEADIALLMMAAGLYLQ